MALDKKHEFLRDRAVRALANHQVAEAVAKVRAIIGPMNIPDSEPLAQSALDKLRNGETPNADELAALEIVIRILRPVVFSHEGALDDLPDRADQNLQPAELKDLWHDVNGRLLAGFDGFTAADWAKKHTAVSDEDFAANPLRNRLAILLSRTAHVAYHHGQAVLASR